MQLFVVVVGTYVALAAVSDLRARRIPNYVPVLAAVSGLIYHISAPTGWGLWVSLAGFGAGFGLLLAAELAGGGMGDVKLLAALGPWLGARYLLVAFGVGAVLSAATALVALLLGPKSQNVAAGGGCCLRIPRPVGKPGRRRQTGVLPFAVLMAVSTYAVLTWLVIQGGL